MTFKLRSGNGPLAFKNMGSSSPTKKIGLDYEFGSKADLSGSKKNTTLSTDSTKEVRGLEIKDEDTKKFGGKATDLGGKETLTPKVSETKKEAKPKKHQAQIRKQKRLDKITARREKKGKEGLTTRQIELKRRADQAPEEFVAERKEKRAAFSDALTELGQSSIFQGSSGKKLSTNREKKTQDIYNKINQMKVDDKLKAINKENELGETPPVAVNNLGGIKLEPVEIEKSTAAQVHEQFKGGKRII